MAIEATKVVDKNPSNKKEGQGLLDFCIRPDGVSPPWPFPLFFDRIGLGLILNTITIVFGFTYAFREWGFLWGFCLWFIPCCEFLAYCDLMSSNAPGNNIRNLRKQGYTDLQLICFYQFNLVQSQLLSFVVCAVICNDPQLLSWDSLEKNLTWEVPLRILVNLTISEIGFIIGHRLLHTNEFMMKLHVFHHCCSTPSLSTNLLFHPIDLVLEFAGPFLAILVMHFLAWEQHQTTLLATYIVFQLWYAYDHDEHLSLHHAQHHKSCDSVYSVYIKASGNPRQNLLKRYMQTLDIEWPKWNSTGSPATPRKEKDS